MTLEERAKMIASLANECCHRSDGYEEEVYAFALKHLQEAVICDRVRKLTTGSYR